jgi:hypothetical protein
MVADKVQERVAAGELMGAPDGVAVASRLVLLDESDVPEVPTDCLPVCGFGAGHDDHADLLDSGLQDLLDEDREDGLLLAIAVDEGLEGQSALVRRGGRDNGSANFHECSKGRSVTIRRALRIVRASHPCSPASGPRRLPAPREF